MLKILHAFKRLMKLLGSINPDFTLPETLESTLMDRMDEIYPDHHEVLVCQGDVPEYAYFIIRGYVYVYYFNESGNRHMLRFCREGDIVAFLSFLDRSGSPYCIAAGRDTVLSRVHHRTMRYIYEKMPGMYELAMLIILKYDSRMEKLREDITGLSAADRVRMFYKIYAFLLPPEVARMDEEIAVYLRLSERTLGRYRSDLYKNECFLK